MGQSILLFAAGLAAIVPLSGQAETVSQDRQVLTVSAVGTERLAATKADVRLAIEERAATDHEAREAMARRTGNLLDFLREEGVERLETLALRLNPIYDYTRSEREIVGYQAMTVIRFRADASTVGFLIDEALAHGANQVQDLVFTAPEPEIEEARHRALRSATRLALTRAEAVLDELGLSRQDIIRIHLASHDDEGTVFPSRRADGRSSSGDRNAPDVEGGEPEIRVSVTLEVSY